MTFDEKKDVSIENEFVRFVIFPASGRFSFTDKQTGVEWHSNPYVERMGEVVIKQDSESKKMPLKDFECKQYTPMALKLLFDQDDVKITITIELLPDGRTANISYEAGRETNIESIILLDDSLWVSDVEEGYILVPVRLGLLIPANSGKEFKHSFPTFGYEGCHMEMFGVVKNGSAALVKWHEPYITAEIKSTITENKQILSPSLSLRKTAKAFQIQFLGKGDHVTIAKAYRESAKEKGWLVTWDEKLKEYPSGEKLFGAINFKLWTMLARKIDEEGKEKYVNVNWTFKEAAKVAEHLKNDLKLDKVLFIMGGWMHRGYDNQHPDILPTAPECGGDKDFAECIKQIQELGYMVSLHDNYQDIYGDSPSWDENLIMKRPDGSLVKGGIWLGGQAWLTCSREAVKLAQRPQNLPKVKKLFDPESYFIDTTYAAGLCECYDPHHPLSLWDDMIYKSEISDYARSLFGNFGSECGREWAIPHSDYFEGLTGVSGKYYHNLDITAMGAVVVPLFEMVYRDCIAMYGKYGYDFSKAAEYVIHHISIGRPLNYHNIPNHLYWQNAPTDELALPESGESDVGCFTRGHNGWTQGMCLVDRFVKNTAEILSPLNDITAKMQMVEHGFLSDDGKVQLTVFRNIPASIFDQEVRVVVNKGDRDFSIDSKYGKEVVLPPYGFLIECPTFIAFHALSWNGIKYDSPALFAIQSQNVASIEWSSNIRIFHGFGDSRLKLGSKILEVVSEAVAKMK